MPIRRPRPVGPPQTPRLHGSFALAGLVALACLFRSDPVKASSATTDSSGASPSPATEGSTDRFSASYGQSFPFVVPPYHGLEPQLGLRYDSSAAGSDTAGVGWTTTGFSTIVRSSPGRGTPRFDLDRHILARYG